MRIIGAPPEQAASDVIRASSFTHITGHLKRKDRDGTKDEVRTILNRAKVPGLTWAGK